MRSSAVHSLRVGRNPEFVLRMLDALRSGGLCPSTWTRGDGTIDPAKELQPGRVLIFGESEIRFLESLSPVARQFALAKSFEQNVPCLLVTSGAAVPEDVVTEADRAGLPLLGTSVPTAAAIGKITALLEDRLAAREMVHGVLLDVLGLGVMLAGESGIGKSECALDLVCRGHRLVADDTVEIRRRAESIIIGSCPDLTRHHMEVRGLGIINIRDLFGVASTRTSKRIELVVQLERWAETREYDRLGLDEEHLDLMGLKIPLVRMPVAPGRNLATLVEVAARNQLLRARGINVEEVQNIIFDGAAAASCRIQLMEEPAPDVLAGIKSGNPDIISVEAIRLDHG